MYYLLRLVFGSKIVYLGYVRFNKNVVIMSKRILIPDVKRDERIGSVFNYLFVVTNSTEIEDTDIEWDFSASSFFHPFFIAPLAIFKNRSEKRISCIKIPKYLSNYFDLIHFNDILELADKKTNWKIY